MRGWRLRRRDYQYDGEDGHRTHEWTLDRSVRYDTVTVKLEVLPRRRIRWPFVSRRRHEFLEQTAGANVQTIHKQQQALAKLGHARDQAYRDAAQVLADLRVLRLHIERTPYKSFYEGPVRVQFEIAEAVIYDTYRRNGTFKEIVGYMIEDAFMRSPAGRSSLFTQPGEAVPT